MPLRLSCLSVPATLGLVLALSVAPAHAYINYTAAAFDIVPAPSAGCGYSVPSSSYFHQWQAILSTPSGPFYYVYLFACMETDTAGVGGLECGIDYPGGYSPGGGQSPINVFSWNLCADLEFPSTGWPAPGGGNVITWSRPHCPRATLIEALGLAGYFYVGAYAPGAISITPRPVTGTFKIVTCDAVEIDDTALTYTRGVAGFGPNYSGYNACAPGDPVERTTWSRIKALHR